MKCFLVLLGVVVLSQAGFRSYSFQNPAGVTYFGFGSSDPQPLPQLQPQQPIQPQEQPQQQQQDEQQQQAAAADQAAQEFAEQQQQQQQQQQQEQQQQQDAQDSQEAAGRNSAEGAQQQQAQQQQVAQFHRAVPAEYQYASPLGYTAPAVAKVAAPVSYAAPAYAAHAYTAPAYAAQAYASPAYAAPAYATKVAAPVAYSHPHAYAAPALAVHQKVSAPLNHYHQQQYYQPQYQPYVGYAATPVLTKVAGVADVPVTKLAYSHGVTQKLVDVAQPAVSTRKLKVRRPALRKEFYDIEHRVIIRPAGSATLELTQPISKEQKGPAVLTPTNFVHHAPVVRYGASRQILDGEGQAAFAQMRAAGRFTPDAAGRVGGRVAGRTAQTQQPAQAQQQQQQPSPAPAQRTAEDTEVIEASTQGQEQPQQQSQAQEQQPQPEQPQQQGPQPQGLPQGRVISPDMPAELQQRLINLLTAKGGTVTEILTEDGRPADSASVLQVADALGDLSLQGGERITTRRIVVTRPIETIQDVEVQEPATKFHRVAVNQPTVFKHAIPAVARVPVAVPAVKHIATPVVAKYASPLQYAHYAAPGAYAAYAH